MRRLLLLIFVLTFALSATSLAQDPGSIVDAVVADTDLTIFVSALAATNLHTTLAANGPYTVFAPTDDAFNALLVSLNLSAEALFEDSDMLRDLLLYHVVAGEVPSNQLAMSTQLTALNNGVIVVAAAGGTVTLNASAQVVRPDIDARNGIIHVVDRVLAPGAVEPVPTEPPTLAPAFVRLAHLSADTPEVDVYIDGVLRGGASLSAGQISDWARLPAAVYSFSFVPRGGVLQDALFGPISVTLPADAWITLAVLGSSTANNLRVALIDENTPAPFAPNEARVTFFHAVENAGPLDVWLGDSVVLFDDVAYGEYAVLDVPVGSFDIRVSTSLTPEPLRVEVPPSALEAGSHYFVTAWGTVDAPVFAVNVLGHADVESIAAGEFMLTPAPDIITVLATDGRFTELLAALERANLTERLREAPTVTLFAPPDAAFAALPEGMIDALLANPDALANLLLYHAVLDDVLLTGPDAPLTAVGVPLLVTMDGTAVLVNGTTLVGNQALVAGNGRVYVVDSVLLPPTN